MRNKDKDSKQNARYWGKRIKAEQARVAGIVHHQQCEYYIIEDCEMQETAHVLCALRPSWVNKIDKGIK